MAETELEEGEACHYKDDASIDPDIALSYIDEKLQSVLGHFQKDFEGGVSAENLGAKFGGYGSFLPTHQRFPSIWCQPKSPQRLQNHITPRSPYNFPVEGTPQNSRALSVSPVTQRLGTASHTSHSLHTTRLPSGDVSVNKGCISSSQVTEELPLKHDPSSSKPDRQTDLRTLKVRIKVGSDNTACKNAAIYSGLGLISPSSSTENSPEENDCVPLEPQEILDESAARILQIMTSFPVSSGLLLSPLHDRLICLIRKERLSRNSNAVTTKTLKEVEKGVSIKRKENNKDKAKDRLLYADVVKEESLKAISCQDGDKCDRQDAKNSPVEKILKNGVRIADKDVSGCRSKDGNKISGPLKDEFDVFNTKRGPNFGPMERHKQMTGQKAIPHGCDEIKVAHGMEKLSYGSQKKSTENQINSKLAANNDEERLMAGPEYMEKTIKVHNLKPQKNICKVRNDYGDVSVDTRLGNKGIQMGPLERSSVDKVNDSNLENVEKEGPEFFDRLKERPGCVKVDNKLTSETVLKEAPDVGPPTGDGLASELKESSVAPVIILDNWVCCDRCEKWRLLPFGMDSDQLPDKWLCSMLNWLPAGMNSCDVSEEETTKALNALYQLPVPESQNNVQNHADKAATEVGSADQNHMYVSSHTMPKQGKKKHVSKRTSSAVSCERKLQISNSTKNLLQEEVKSRSLNDMNQGLFESNPISNSNIQNLSKSCNFATEKHTCKEKEKHESGGVAKKKMLKDKIEADQHGYASRKKIKTEGTTTTNKYWTSEHGGKVVLSASTELPTKSSGKNLQKHCEDYYSNDAKCKQKNKAQISVKKLANCAQVSLDGGSLGLKHHNEREISVKKRKLKDWQESQNYLETSRSNVKHISDNKVSVKESSVDFELRKQRKSNGRITRILLSGSRDNPSIENDQQPRKLEAKVASKQASDDANLLKRVLGSEQFSMAATSSSSKVSDSRKTKAGFQEVNGSPVESVSSSPMRTSNLGNSDGKICNFYVVHSPRKSMDGDANVEYRSGTRKDKVSGVFHPESLGFPTLDFRDKKSSHKLSAEAQCPKPSSEFGNTHLISNPLFTKKSGKSSPFQSRDNNRSSGSNFGRIKIKVSDPLNEHEEVNIKKKLRGDAEMGSTAVKDDNNGGEGDTMTCFSQTIPRSQQGSDIDLLPVDALGGGDVTKILKQPRNVSNGHGICHNLGSVSSIRCGVGDLRAPSPLRKDASGQAASNTLKEAEVLRDTADRLKNSGFGLECNEAYFQAALKFLHGASLLETCNSGSSKQGEMTQLQIYSSAAKLCEICAHEYEKRQEMAAAALAYKCMEVAYMRVVYCKNSTTSRDRQDLQASAHMLPQGESPSSSVSDIDNLNNQPMVDKAALSKGITSHAGNHIIIARNRPHLIRLLDFTNNVNSAMEASRKSHKAYVAANLVMEETQNKDGIISVKRVIDFSFQDIEELVRLVKLAIEAINRQGFSGGKD